MKRIPAFPLVPESDAEVAATFGDLSRYVRGDGTLSPDWEKKFITRIKLPSPVAYAYGDAKITQVTVHVALADVAVALFASIWRADLVAALGPYGGGFVYRRNANNPADISLHAYGIAWDWDPSGFPNGSAKKRDARLVAEFTRFGFVCGQDFKRTPDPMHFQFARNT